MKNRFARKAAAILAAFAVWQILAAIIHQPILLVAPTRVLARLMTIWREPGFAGTLFFSFSRIVLGFLFAFLAGTVLGVVAGRFPVAEALLWPYMLTIKAVPVVSFIIMAFIWLSARQLNVFIAFLMVLPVVYVNTLEGYRTADQKLLEMAKLFRVPWPRKLRYIYLPHMKPFLISACSAAIGLSWKAGVAAEVIGISPGSIGERLYEAKITLQMADLACWTLLLVLISLAFEKLFLWVLRRAFAALELR